MKAKLLVFYAVALSLCSLAFVDVAAAGCKCHKHHVGHHRYILSYRGGVNAFHNRNEVREFRDRAYDVDARQVFRDGMGYVTRTNFKCDVYYDDTWLFGTSYDIDGPCYVNYDDEVRAIEMDPELYP